MPFNGREGAIIPLAEAATLCSAFKAANPGKTKGAFLGKDAIADLMNQAGAEGVRIYFGLDTAGNVVPVIVAADANEDDILVNNKVYDNMIPCPAHCGTPNDLNR